MFTRCNLPIFVFINQEMDTITITEASLKDIKSIQRIGRETFYETFAQNNSEADMIQYLNECFNEKQIETELSNPDSLFFIAWETDNPIGYLRLNRGKAQTEVQDETALEIERIYVKAEYHGKKVGQLLYEKALDVARKEKKSSIWLGVWEGNPRAINFYEKNGFVAFGEHIFKLGKDEQTDIMMKKILE